MLQYNILATSQKKLFDIFSNSEFISNYYLAGGTSLAFQIGHRMSEDFDFFTSQDLNPLLLKDELSKIGEYKISHEEKNTLHCVLNDTKISFLTFKYKLLDEVTFQSKIKLCSLRDIACMKLWAIQSRGTKRDFVDFYFILKKLGIQEILQDYRNKFGEGNFNLLLIKKSLIFFDDAEPQLMPAMIEKADWDEIKKTLRKIENSI